MSRFKNTDQPATASYIQFADQEKYPGLASNQDLQNLGRHIKMVRDQTKHIQTSGVNTEQAGIVATYNLFDTQSKNLGDLKNKALFNIEAAVKDAQSKLFSNTAQISVEEGSLTGAILNMYQDPNADQTAMIDNPNSARHLASLAKLGLVGDTVLQNINSKHSPEATESLEQARKDIGVLEKMEREYQTFKSINNDPEQAQRLVAMGTEIGM